jgi:hypothetical protein
MKEHNLENFMKLVNHPKTKDDVEIESDTYYRNVYKRIAAGHKYSFNWCAFLFNSGWLIYRKMYLYSLLYFILMTLCQIILGLFSFYVTESISITYIKILFIILTWFLSFAPIIALGFIGNWLYVRQIHKKIDRGYHKANLKSVDGITLWLPTVMFLIIFISGELFSGKDEKIGDAIFFFCLVLSLMIFAISIGIHVIRDKRKVAAALAAEK